MVMKIIQQYIETIWLVIKNFDLDAEARRTDSFERARQYGFW